MEAKLVVNSSPLSHVNIAIPFCHRPVILNCCINAGFKRLRPSRQIRMAQTIFGHVGYAKISHLCTQDHLQPRHFQLEIYLYHKFLKETIRKFRIFTPFKKIQVYFKPLMRKSVSHLACFFLDFVSRLSLFTVK